MAENVSEYRKNKYAVYFEFVDTNKDGYLTIEDFIQNIHRLRDLGGLGKEKITALQKEMVSWWGLYCDEASKNQGKLNKTQFVHKTAEYHGSNDTVSEVFNHYARFFDYLDQNGDQEISMDELALYYRTHNCPELNVVKEIFQRVDKNKDGRITRDEWAKAGVGYWLSDDPINGFDFLYDFTKSVRE